MKRILILGAGTGGTMMANKLVGSLPAGWQVTVVDRAEQHLYQPGLLFLPFGGGDGHKLLRPRPATLDKRVELRIGQFDRIDPDARTVALQNGTKLAFDVAIVATGARLLPEATPGLTDGGWRQSAFDFYTLDGALALQRRLADWKGGRIVLNVAEMPIKCPVAPLEFLLLADAWLKGKGLRHKTAITYATPLEGAFTKPVASRLFGDLLTRRGIDVLGDFSVSEVDGARRVLKAYDGRETPYDLLVTIPQHGGAEVIADSGLGDASGWLPTDKHTLQAKAFPHVFALGDATDLPSSKAGSVAHFQAEVLHDNVLRFVRGEALLPACDGHANCFVETGRGQAMLIDFDYDTEPLPGRFPFRGVGPFTLLGESRVNHWGKLAFETLYWNVLLPGRVVPFVGRPERKEVTAVKALPKPAAVCPMPTPKPDEGLNGAWSEDYARQTAEAQGIVLDEPRWTVIRFARAEFAATHVSPNIRRITQGTGLSTRDLYALYPQAPARTVARIAGLPKPAGCL